MIVNYWSWNNQESWLAMLNPLTWMRLLWSEMRWDRIGMTYGCEGAADRTRRRLRAAPAPRRGAR